MPTTALNLSLDPSSTTFGYKDLPISVGTNNETGFTMTISTTGDITDLVNTADSNVKIETLPAQTGGYTDTDFVVNKWGYKNGLSNNYFPFQSGATVLENDTSTNEKSTILRFATKIDYMQQEGTYSTTFNFSLVANPIVTYMQDLNPTLCTSTPQTVVDKRDSKEYTIARLADGQCWMTSDLNLAGNTKLYSETSNVPAGYPEAGGTPYYTLPDGTGYSGKFGSDTTAYVYNSGNETTSQAGCTSSQPCNSYYSWLAATAGGKNASGDAVTDNGYNTAYSICPKGWRLPTATTSDANATSNYNWKTGDFYKLATAYGANLENSYSYQGSATFGPSTIPNFLFAGVEYSSALLEGGVRGRYWLSSSYSSVKAYNILIWETGVELNSDGYGTRRSGMSVRCILDDTRTLNDITYMQDMNPQIAAKMNDGDTATLKDSRDGQDYTIAKLADGNVWMTRNLAIGCNGTDSTYGSTITPVTLTNTNSNISASTWATPTNSLTLGDDYTDPRMECSSTYGAWYNYAAATAGTITGSSNTTNATYNICPAGWRLPINTELYINSYKADYIPVAGGHYESGSATGYSCWYSSVANGNQRYIAYYDGVNINASGSGYRNYGYYVRCIAK